VGSRRFDSWSAPEGWSPGLNACTSDLEASQHPVRPYAPERLFFGYKGRLRLLRGHLVDSAELRRRPRRSCCRKNIAKYRPHRPHSP
jgi:hypothetical protein